MKLKPTGIYFTQFSSSGFRLNSKFFINCKINTFNISIACPTNSISTYIIEFIECISKHIFKFITVSILSVS